MLKITKMEKDDKQTTLEFLLQMNQMEKDVFFFAVCEKDLYIHGFLPESPGGLQIIKSHNIKSLKEYYVLKKQRDTTYPQHSFN